MSRKKALIDEIDRVTSLINASCRALGIPQTHLKKTYGYGGPDAAETWDGVKKNIADHSTTIGEKIQNAVQKGRPEELLLVGAFVAVGALADPVYNMVKYRSSEKKMIAELREDYSALAKMQGRLVDEQQRLVQQLNRQSSDLTLVVRDALGQSLSEINDLLKQIASAMQERTV